MGLPERRIIGSLLLMSGLTALVLGLYTGQLDHVLELVKTVLETTIAGAP